MEPISETEVLFRSPRSRTKCISVARIVKNINACSFLKCYRTKQTEKCDSVAVKNYKIMQWVMGSPRLYEFIQKTH
jgi:hypothetical protein